jgi:hypothetical protein
MTIRKLFDTHHMIVQRPFPLTSSVPFAKAKSKDGSRELIEEHIA